MQESDGEEKIRLLYLVIGSVTMYSAGYVYFLYLYKFKMYPIADFLVVLCNLIAAYGIVRHQLMDIEVIIRRAAVFAGLFAFAYGVFASIAYLGQTFFQKFIVNRWVVLIPSVLIIVIAFEPLKNLLVRLTDKFLFQKKYDYKELLKTFSGEVLTVLDLNKLVKLTVDKLSSIVRLENCAVLLFDKEKGNYKIASSNNLKETNTAFEKDDPIIKFIHETHTYILKNKDIQNMPDTGTIKEDMKRLEAELILPIVLHNDLVGLISLGRKKSGGEFTEEDLSILLPLAQTEAIALSNAELFDELGKTQQEAAQREKMAVVGTLAAGMAHEIRNPLTAIRVFAEAVPEKYNDSNFRDKFQKIVTTEVDRIDHLIKQLLDFAKPSPPIFEAVNLTDLIDETLSLLEAKYKYSNIEIVKDYPDNIPIIQADSKQLRQVFLNLFLNAIDAMDSKTSSAPGAEEGLIISIAPTDESIVISIKDSGLGMTKDDLRHIFEPFYSKKDKGTGLGLFIVYNIIHSHNGRIRVNSTLGKGTEFMIELPIKILLVENKKNFSIM